LFIYCALTNVVEVLINAVLSDFILSFILLWTRTTTCHDYSSQYAKSKSSFTSSQIIFFIEGHHTVTVSRLRQVVNMHEISNEAKLSKSIGYNKQKSKQKYEREALFQSSNHQWD